MKNFFKIFSLAALIVSLSSQITFAEAELIEATGYYIADSTLDESPASAYARAREEAKRLATEKAGVYLKSYSVVKDLQLEYDEVKTVAAQLLKIQDETKKIEPYADELLKFSVTIHALVEVQNDEILKTMMSDRQSLEEATERYKKLQAEYDNLKQQLEELKGNYRTATPTEKIQIKESIEKNNKYLAALIELEQGNNFYFRKDYQNAISAYSRAIGISPNFAEAYNNRGNAYVQMQQFQPALQDLQNAVRLNSVDARIHNNLGGVYLVMKNYNAAINECTQALNLNPNLFTAYFNRALAYAYLGQYQNALPDSQRAMQLNPSDTNAKNLYNQIIKRLN